MSRGGGSGEVIGRVRGGGHGGLQGGWLAGLPPLPFSPSLGSVCGGSVTRSSTCTPPSKVLSTSPPYQRKEGKGRLLAPFCPALCLPSKSLVGIPQSQSDLRASGWRSWLCGPRPCDSSKDVAASLGPTFFLFKSSSWEVFAQHLDLRIWSST